MAGPATAYARAGVDIAAGEELARRIGRMGGSAAASGGFAAVLDIPAGRDDPVMLASCDGVGTKLLLLREHGLLETAGIDLVAMCANDLLCLGGEPAYFLDYYSCSRLDVAEAERVVAGIVRGCEQAGCRLAGGETAELPGLVAADAFDLAGFAVGFAERSQLLGASRVQVGDAVVALGSTGPHSSGFSLIRQILEQAGPDRISAYADGDLMDALLAPTDIYAGEARALRKTGGLHALAHITGGGLAGNLARAIPDGLCAQLDGSRLKWPPVFAWLAAAGQADAGEMRAVFNCGIGMAAVVAHEAAPDALDALEACGTEAWQIGTVAAGEERVAVR